MASRETYTIGGYTVVYFPGVRNVLVKNADGLAVYSGTRSAVTAWLLRRIRYGGRPC